MNILVDDKPISLSDLSTMQAPGAMPPLPPVRYSRLRLMSECPAIYDANHVEQTACMEQGSAVDYLIYGTKPVIAYPGAVRRGNEFDKFAADNSGSLIVTRNEFEEATAIANAVKSDKRAMRVLRGEHQKEIFWTFCGRNCVSHLDTLGFNGAWITELKVSQTSNPARFRWHALKMHYHCQLGFYDDAAASINKGIHPRAHYIVCVGATFPHVVTVFRLTHKAIQFGKKLNRLWMERLLQCEAAQEFPGYSQSIVDLDVADDEILESEAVPF